MKPGPKNTVCVQLPLDWYDQVKEQAEQLDKTVPGYIRQVLRCYLWHVENAPETLTGRWIIP